MYISDCLELIEIDAYVISSRLIGFHDFWSTVEKLAIVHYTLSHTRQERPMTIRVTASSQWDST